jgi:hypothetical protein
LQIALVNLDERLSGGGDPPPGKRVVTATDSGPLSVAGRSLKG